MNQMISILLPSIIGLRLYDRINKTEEKTGKRIERYLTYVLFVNLITYIVTIYLFKYPNINFTYKFTTKYIVLALVVSVIVSVLETIIKKNLDIGVIVEKNEEKD